MERKYQGAKVPPMELSLPGAKVRDGNESSIIPARVYTRHGTGSLGRWVTKCDPVPCLVYTVYYAIPRDTRITRVTLDE